MNNLKRRTLSSLLVVMLLALTASTAEATRPSALACGSWSVVPSPSPANFYNSLNGVVAVSSRDVWAVGYDFANGGSIQTLIEHWDGTRWQAVASPNAGSSSLGAVTALSATNVWAVGSTGFGTFIEHWDGVQWKIVPSPSVGNYLNSLNSVSALSPSDIWAVGADEQGSGAPIRTLIEHWDGHRWSIVASPNVGSYNTSLQGVSALSPSDVWAVGDYSSVNRPIVIRPLSQHWDGQQWKIVHVPSSNGSTFNGVATIKAKDIWAVGRDPSSNTLTERWNGRRWQSVSSPSPGDTNNSLTAVAARTSRDVWSVGYDLSMFGSDLFATLSEHWDGTSWQVVASPNVAGQDNYLNGVAVVAPHGVWAVGYTQPHNGYSSTTLIEYYC